MTGQTAVQVLVDLDYAEGIEQVRRMLAHVDPLCQPKDTLAEMVGQLGHYVAQFVGGDLWTIETWRKEYRLLMDQYEAHVKQHNVLCRAIQKLARLSGQEVTGHPPSDPAEAYSNLRALFETALERAANRLPYPTGWWSIPADENGRLPIETLLDDLVAAVREEGGLDTD